MAAKDTMVKEYSGDDRARAYEQDARQLAAQGWVVLNATDLEQRPGCINLLGPLRNVFAPQLKLRVTYMRPDAATT
ncbi:MAG: hypothetical protein ACHQ4H_11590 [Ktedonobacterales bacterium]